MRKHDYVYVCTYKGFDIYFDVHFQNYGYGYSVDYWRESSSWTDEKKVREMIDKKVKEKGFSFDNL